MDNNGGYEYEFLANPPDRVLCKICQNPCRDAYLTGCCGTNFCHSCLLQLKKAATAINKACPMCREEKFRIFPNKGLDREIKSLNVYCENRRGGCTWSGEINDAERHITADCQFVEITCPSKCGMKLKRQCVQQHIAKECPCHCQYCGTTGKKDVITAKHKTHCPQYPQPCPNGCELGVVPSAGMAAHRKICPLELVQCEYYVVGCECLVARGKLEEHYTQKMAEHLSLVKSKLATNAKALAESEKKLISVGKELGAARKSLHNTLLTCGKLEETVTETEAELRWLVDEEYCSTKNEVDNLKFTTAMQYEQVLAASFYVKTIFMRYNFCILAIMVLFGFVYVTQLKLTNERMLQSEQYTWPKTLDYVSELSAANNSIVPFIFKIHKTIQALWVDSALANFNFRALDGEYAVSMSMEYSRKGKSVSISLSFDKAKLEEIGEWPLKTMFTVELLNQLYNDDHYIIPILVNYEFDKICHLSNDDTAMVCKMYFISVEYLVKESQYFHNNTAYFRISQVSYREGVWNVYNWFGATIFNLLSTYKIWIVWAAIGALGVTAIVKYHTAWLDDKPTTVILSMLLIALMWSVTP